MLPFAITNRKDIRFRAAFYGYSILFKIQLIYMKRLILSCALAMLALLGTFGAKAQGIAYNSTGSTADSSAILDIASTNKGVLVPRMTGAQRGSIAAPAIGLMVFQTDGPSGFYFYNGSTWVSLNAYTNVTTQGNTFNGATQLVQLDGSGALPAVSGSVVTNLNASNLTTGMVSTGQLASSGTASSSTFLRGDNTWATPTGVTPGGSAGGDLTGTYPNPSIASNVITSAKILDGTIVNSDVSSIAAIAYSKLSLGSSISLTDMSATGSRTASTFLRGDNTWATPTDVTPGGSAGGDLTGTYPNPTLTNTGVAAGSYGSLTSIPTITVNTKGRITAVSTNTINSLPAGSTIGDMLYWSGSAWTLVGAGRYGQVLQASSGSPTWVWVNPNINSNPTLNLSIGASYGGGKVYYILQSGDLGYDPLIQHGLICALVDQSTSNEFLPSAYWYTAIGLATHIGGGMNNTNSIIALGGTTASYAAKSCRSYNGGGYNDWYLPSQDELNKLFLNRAIIGGLSGVWYWSSSDAGIYGMIQHFSTGSQSTNYKYGTFYVRAVRSF